MINNRTTELCKALDFMRIWISNDAHLKESKLNYELEKTEELRKLETVKRAIARILEKQTCEYIIEGNMNELEGMSYVWFRCTNCNTCYDYLADKWLMKMLYCHKYGTKVVER